ncbi:MAG TPA: DUF5916 domain-containing protein [Thermoanaerobaculia bacterium]|nr:DUF5916 domain-containing protein [Thermoanaerobaculia bacterium]
MQRMMLFLLSVFVCAAALAVPTRVDIAKVAGTITVDGDPAEAAWGSAKRIEGFVEYYKGDNNEPPAKTVGLLAYDAEAVYVAFVADDPRPSAIRAPLVDRDKVLGDQDYVAILIDTLNDRRSGVAFRVNPRGVQTDSVVNDANGEEDFSPDFFYEAVARRTERGWSAEMRIPLASLRYPPSDPQTWGVIMMRNYPRDFRYIMANTPIPKNSGCFLCHASEVAGLEGLPAGSHFTIAPYSTASISRQSTVGSRQESDFGLDLKWNPSAGLTLDGTLNPDFSQIEADVPQIDVNNRFALSYAEKRTFFLEGVDLLATPIAATYTRSIASPAWGMRATGNAGASAYTFLVAEDRGGGSVILPGPQGSEFVPQDFRSRIALGRIRRSFGESFGAFLVSARENEGGGHNRVLGPDFLWKRNDRDRLLGQLLISSTENPDRPDLSAQFRGQSFDGHAYRVVFTRDSKRYDIWAATTGYSPGFRADNGFVAQTGFRRVGLWPGLRFYPKRFFSYVRPYTGLEHDAGFENGETLRTGAYQGFEFQGKWGSNGWMTAGHVTERVGSTLLTRDQLEFNLRAAPLGWLPAIQADGTLGDKIDYAGARLGKGATLNLSGTVRATDHLELQLRTSREWLDLDSGRLFNAQIDWLKATYTFSPRSLVRAIAQRSAIERGGTTEQRTTLSGLYAWKLNWQTVFFVGYGDAQDAQSVFMKVAYAFQR